MNHQTDSQLLHAYAESRSEAAFAELVRRHVDFTYSAALRMVRDTHLAEDVTQGVFVALAKGAPELAARVVLSGWLHRTAQNIAAQMVRTIERRRAREQEAADMNELLSDQPEASWEKISPHLDIALGELNDTDREALLLRYFEKKSAQEMAGILRISDEAAQKRVSRAVERIREIFSKRNVTIGASGLVVLISANAVQAAPPGLAAAISAAVLLTGTAVTTSTAIAVINIIAMTTIQKTFVAVTVAALAGTGIYEAHQAAQLRAQNEALQRQQTSLSSQVRQLQRERDDSAKQFAHLATKNIPRMPVPQLQASISPANGAGGLQLTNINTRFKDRGSKLSAEQVDAYLQSNGRIASSLLAAYRTSRDPALLKEAMEKYPNDPQVAFEAVYSRNASSEEQRQWLNTFEQSAPNNALANYLSAFNYFNSGQIDQGVQELTVASGKQLDDYTLNRVQDDEAAYLSASYSEAEAERIADSSLNMSQLPQLKQLGVDLVDLANAYNKSGNVASAQSTYQMAINLGQRFADPSTDPMLISQAVGSSIEKIALTAMDPNSSYGNSGQTVQNQLTHINQNNTAIKDLVQQATPLMPALSDQDMINYENRRRTSGEVSALQWVVGKYGQQ